MSERHVVSQIAAWLPVSRELLADAAKSWQERAVILGAADPCPWPRFRLWGRNQ